MFRFCALILGLMRRTLKETIQHHFICAWETSSGRFSQLKTVLVHVLTNKEPTNSKSLIEIRTIYIMCVQTNEFMYHKKDACVAHFARVHHFQRQTILFTANILATTADFSAPEEKRKKAVKALIFINSSFQVQNI